MRKETSNPFLTHGWYYFNLLEENQNALKNNLAITSVISHKQFGNKLGESITY